MNGIVIFPWKMVMFPSFLLSFPESTPSSHPPHWDQHCRPEWNTLDWAENADCGGEIDRNATTQMAKPVDALISIGVIRVFLIREYVLYQIQFSWNVVFMEIYIYMYICVCVIYQCTHTSGRTVYQYLLPSPRSHLRTSGSQWFSRSSLHCSLWE